MYRYILSFLETNIIESCSLSITDNYTVMVTDRCIRKPEFVVDRVRGNVSYSYTTSYTKVNAKVEQIVSLNISDPPSAAFIVHSNTAGFLFLSCINIAILTGINTGYVVNYRRFQIVCLI